MTWSIPTLSTSQGATWNDTCTDQLRKAVGTLVTKQAHHQVENAIMASLLYRQQLHTHNLQARLSASSHIIRELAQQLT